MSMAANSSDLVDETSGANLQMDGYVDMPPQSAKDLQELEASDSFPTGHLGPWPGGCHPVALIKTLFRDMCDFDRRIGGSAPILSFLDGTPHGRYAA